MGTDLVLKHLGETIAHLGRKHYLLSDTDDPIAKSDSIVDMLIKEMTKYAAYSPKDSQELNVICVYITTLIENSTDNIKLLARHQLLTDIIDRPIVTLEEE